MTREELLKKLSQIPAVLACAVRQPDGHFLVHCASEAHWPAQIEQLATSVVESCLAMVRLGLQAPRFCWQFERAWIYCALRPDGASICLLTEQHPEGTDVIKHALNEFATEG